MRVSSREDVLHLLAAPTAAAAVGAAIVTGLLWRLAAHPLHAAEVAQTLGIPGRRAHYWLQLLESVGILDSGPDGYVPSQAARAAILDTYSQESWQHLVLDQRERNGCLPGVPWLIGTPGSVWTAQGLEAPASYVDRMRASPERAREFTRMLFEVHRNLAARIADLLDLTEVTRLMDLGGNSGVVSMALLRRHPQLSATVVDIANVCAAGRELAEAEGLSARIAYHAAEFATDELPSGFDLVLQCDVGVYDDALVRKVHRALNPGGRAVYVDHFAAADGLAPATRVEWTFLDSLHDPHCAFPTLDGFVSRLVAAGFECPDAPQTLSNGWWVIQARKPDAGGRTSAP